MSRRENSRFQAVATVRPARSTVTRRLPQARANAAARAGVTKGSSVLVTTMLGRELSQVLHDREPSTGETGPGLLNVRGLARGRRVRDVSFDVRGGEIVGLAGLLGSGRTESVRVVFGADRSGSPSGG